MCVCVPVSFYVSVGVYVHPCVSECVGLCIWTSVCICPSLRVFMCVSPCVCVCMCLCSAACVHAVTPCSQNPSRRHRSISSSPTLLCGTSPYASHELGLTTRGNRGAFPGLQCLGQGAQTDISCFQSLSLFPARNFLPQAIP